MPLKFPFNERPQSDNLLPYVKIKLECAIKIVGQLIRSKTNV